MYFENGIPQLPIYFSGKLQRLGYFFLDQNVSQAFFISRSASPSQSWL